MVLWGVYEAVHTSELLDRSGIDLGQKQSECERSNVNWDRSKRVWNRSKRVWTLSQIEPGSIWDWSNLDQS